MTNNSAIDKSVVPDKISWYVPCKNYQVLFKIISSEKFMPVYITGQTGNGKTMSVQQACAGAKRRLVRVNITEETDEDSLLGGFRLVDGNTVWHDGPVVTAMLSGDILLLDEVDLGKGKLLCLQPVLEGSPIFLKRIGRLVHPAPGFNVIATANTKGRGSDDGKYIGTNILNEAFLDRFVVTLEQEYPSEKAEIRILKTQFKNTALTEELIKKLVSWAGQIRSTYDSGALEDNISTRRLVQICSLHTVMPDKPIEDTIKLCLSRMAKESAEAMMSAWSKLQSSEHDNPYAKKKEDDNIDWKDPSKVIVF